MLDAACGSAYGSRLLDQAGAKRVLSIDRSEQAFVEGKRSASLSKLFLAQADVSCLPLSSSQIDLYVSFETIEHVECDTDVIKEAARVLDTAGRFVCSTPNRALLSPGNSIVDVPRNPYHVREYAIEEFVDLLSREFKTITLFAQTAFPIRHQRWVEVAGRLSNGLAVRLHQIRNIASWPWQNETRHRPERMEHLDTNTLVAEVVIAVCQNSLRE